MDGSRISPTVGTRLAMSFVFVAMISIALVATLAIVFGDKDLSALAAQRRADLIRSLAADGASAYNTGAPGWSDADLEPAIVLARAAGASIAFLDSDGRPVASSIPDPVGAKGATRTPISVSGTRIGTLVVVFHGRGIDASANSLSWSLLLAVVAGAGVAGLLALAVATVASRRLTRPVVRLIETARAVAAGDQDASVGAIQAPGEIRQLTADFDAMADALARHQQVHRDLVADVAHELRTPVAVLQASCEAMLDHIRPVSVEEIGSLHQEVLRLARLVDDLQTLASADAAALHLSLAPTDLGAVADAAADTLAPHFSDTQIELNRSISPVQVMGDQHRLRQVALNLLTNAAKFTPEGGRVSLEVRRVDQSAELVVRDTGRGIDAEELPHIFERFWRGRDASTASGTGIGLAIVAQLVTAHHGTIAVTSSPGVGTTMTVRLPLSP
jgi:two-component system, OmpR family, sensor histidine kinase BaeS